MDLAGLGSFQGRSFRRCGGDMKGIGYLGSAGKGVVLGLGESQTVVQACLVLKQLDRQ